MAECRFCDGGAMPYAFIISFNERGCGTSRAAVGLAVLKDASGTMVLLLLLPLTPLPPLLLLLLLTPLPPPPPPAGLGSSKLRACKRGI